jgi:multidrug efflux pump subunit AcrB
LAAVGLSIGRTVEVEGRWRCLGSRAEPAIRTFRARSALAVEVSKRIGANIIDTVAEVRAPVETERRH